MNKVILIGRLAADPEIRFTQSNKCVASYRLAVGRAFKAEGQPDADFIGCVAWGKNGEFCQKYLHKGMKIAVEGRIQTRNYDDKDGKKVYVTEVIVDHHEFCESKSSGQAAPTAPAAQATSGGFYDMPDNEDELPF